MSECLSGNSVWPLVGWVVYYQSRQVLCLVGLEVLFGVGTMHIAELGIHVYGRGGFL